MTLSAILEYGCKPYIATSPHIVDSFNLAPFGTELTPFFDGQDETNFHMAYIRANCTAFASDLGIPNWVYIDFVLLQTAAVGFMLAKEKLPPQLLKKFEDDQNIDLSMIDFIPISGQTAGLAADGKTWTGVSLFSLSEYIPDLKSLGLATHTRALALSAYRAKKFVGITQYDNPAVAIHGKTTRALYIKQPIVWMHTRTHMTFVYEQEIDFSLDSLGVKSSEEYSFLLRADDMNAKLKMAQAIATGTRYQIVAPFRIVDGDSVFLPVREIRP